EGIKLENERLRIADRALEALVRLSGDKVLLLLLEDFHWADESSLFGLQYLARNISKSRILLLGTSSPWESDALQKAIESMKGEEILDEINLVKLDVYCTKSLIDLTFAPNDFPDTLAERLYEQSKGNPLFVTEMLKGMLQDGSIAKKSEKYTLVSESYTVPATVEEVVNRRLDALDPDSMAMVEYVSCIGQKFDSSLAASNRMIKDADASLEKLLATGVLLRKSGSLEFSHAVFQSVIYNGIGERWKAGHHKSIGEFLEHRFSGNTDDGVYELARHFSKTKEFRKTSEYCIRAGEKAEGSYAMEHALEFYQIALGALSKLDSSQTKGEFLNIMEREGDIEVLMADYEKALLNYQNALNLTENGNSKAKLMRKIAGIYEKRGEFDKSLDILSEARALIEETRSAEYARNLLGQGFTNWKKGDYDKAMSNLKDAIKIFAETGSEQRDTGNALRAIGNIHWGKGDFGSAREYYERSLAVMEKANDLYGIAAAFANIGIAYDGLGEWDKALNFYNRGLENYEKVGDKSGIAITLGNIGLACQNKGDLKSSIEFYRRSLEIKERIGDRQGIAMSLNNIGNNHTATGDLDKALDFHKRSLVIHEKIGDKRGVAMSLNNVGVVHNLMGETDEALKSHLRSLEVCSDIGQKNLVIYNQVSLSELFMRLGELHTALTHAEKAVSIALEINARPELGQSIQALGMVRREIGEWDEAKKEFEEAKEILEEVGRKEDLAKFRYEYGLLFKAMGESSKARKILLTALADCEDMGMRLWAERCRKALQELDP
ncbi:MAG: tetratricopeptide repeat protein, partial [Thermoplasmata archaeon]